MDDDPTPPLLPIDQMPALHSQEILHRHWRALMGPWGFSHRSLWVNLVDADRRPTPVLIQIDEAPERPEPVILDKLAALLGRLLQEEPGGSVALLLARPGPATITGVDRHWAHGLIDAARRGGVPLDPLHLATDEALRVFAPDDLVEQRTA